MPQETRMDSPLERIKELFVQLRQLGGHSERVARSDLNVVLAAVKADGGRHLSTEGAVRRGEQRQFWSQYSSIFGILLGRSAWVSQWPSGLLQQYYDALHAVHYICRCS